MKSRYFYSLVLLTLLSPAGNASTLLTFDDIPNADNTELFDGYAGFNWDQFYAKQTSLSPNSGYANGTVSSPNVAFNWFANPATISSATPFDLTSGYFTAAWNDGLTVVAIGYLGAVQVAAHTFVIDTSGPTLEVLNFLGVDSVTFTSSGGVHNPNFTGEGTHFALDNLLINGSAVPEPSTFFMSGIAVIAGLGAYARRRRIA